MNKRVGFIGIIIENRENDVKTVNSLLSEYSEIIVARLGVPYKKRGCFVITLVVDSTTNALGALTGKLGAIPSVKVKSALSRTGEK